MPKPMNELCAVCGGVIVAEQKGTSPRLKRHCYDCRKLRQRCRRVGITIDEYWVMFRAQEGKCKLCDNPSFAIDHDHDTGQVRGLLCNGCNLLIGWVEKQKIDLKTVEEYINA